jgi:nucleotide-binding universal stress UspA family protein
MYKRILVTIDMAKLDRGEQQLRRAAALLDGSGEIVVINVVEAVPSYVVVDLPADFALDAMRDAETKLEALCQRLRIPAMVEVRTGQPAAAILLVAAEHAVDLIIVGSHMPDVTNYFLGAIADRLVRHANCSVLVDRR